MYKINNKGRQFLKNHISNTIFFKTPPTPNPAPLKNSDFEDFNFSLPPPFKPDFYPTFSNLN